MNIHDYMTEKTGLAETYARDGAFHSAARVLKELAEHVEKHARACDKDLDDIVKHSNSPERKLAAIRATKP